MPRSKIFKLRIYPSHGPRSWLCAVQCKIETSCNIEQRARAEPGHQETLGKSFHSRRSIQDPLHTGHSIGATHFAGLTFGNAPKRRSAPEPLLAPTILHLPESWKTRVDTPPQGCLSSHFSVGFTGRAEKAKPLDLVQFGGKCFIGVNGEISRNNG